MEFTITTFMWSILEFVNLPNKK